MGALPYERMVIAVPAAAVIDRALELTIEYTKQRKIFGAPLFDMQTTRQKLAEMATIAHVVRSFVNDCTQRLLDGTLDNEAAYSGGAPNSSAAWWTSVSNCSAATATWPSTRSRGCMPLRECRRSTAVPTRS